MCFGFKLIEISVHVSQHLVVVVFGHLYNGQEITLLLFDEEARDITLLIVSKNRHSC